MPKKYLLRLVYNMVPCYAELYHFPAMGKFVDQIPNMCMCMHDYRG